MPAITGGASSAASMNWGHFSVTALMAIPLLWRTTPVQVSQWHLTYPVGVRKRKNIKFEEKKELEADL